MNLHVVGKYKFQWGSEQEGGIYGPKRRTNNQCDAFVLDTDASDFAMGAELLKIHDGKGKKVIAYGSYSLTTDQRKYCATRKELLAVVRFTHQYRHYLLGHSFMVRTDHSSLTWLMHFHEPQGQLPRSQYYMVLRHREGRKHTNADALSRIMAEESHCSAFERVYIQRICRVGAVSFALGQTKTGEPLQKLSTMQFHWSLRWCLIKSVVMATSLTPLGSAAREADDHRQPSMRSDSKRGRSSPPRPRHGNSPTCQSKRSRHHRGHGPRHISESLSSRLSGRELMNPKEETIPH